MIRAGKYVSQLVPADKLSRLDIHGVVEWKMHIITEFTKAKNRHEPLEGTSALYTVYASFFFLKQRSDMSHSEEQARYALCMPRSLSKGLT